jgi:hypothetical protein
MNPPEEKESEIMSNKKKLTTNGKDMADALGIDLSGVAA